MATATSLGYIKKDSDVEQLSVANRPITLVLVGDSGDMKDDNGAIGTHTFKVPGTTSPLTIPAGYTVYRTDIRVVTAPTSGGSATLSLGTNASGQSACFNTLEAIAQFPANDPLIVANVATNHVATSGEAVSFTVAAFALTAGRLIAYINLYAAV